MNEKFLFNMDLVNVLIEIEKNVALGRIEQNYKSKIYRKANLNLGYVNTIIRRLKQLEFISDEKEGRVCFIGITEKGKNILILIKQILGGMNGNNGQNGLERENQKEKEDNRQVEEENAKKAIKRCISKRARQEISRKSKKRCK